MDRRVVAFMVACAFLSLLLLGGIIVLPLVLPAKQQARVSGPATGPAATPPTPSTIPAPPPTKPTKPGVPPRTQPVPPPPVDVPRPGTGGKLLAAADFTPLGAFRLPAKVGPSTTAFSHGGLAHRYVDGQIHFFTYVSDAQLNSGEVFEFAAPEELGTIGKGPNYPFAKVVRFWGDVFQGQQLLEDSCGDVTGTAQEGSTATTIVLDGKASDADNGRRGGALYLNYFIQVTAGPRAAQGPRLVTAYKGASRTATVSPAWTTPPQAGDAYRLSAWGNKVTGGGTNRYGLYWDEPRQRLYWNYGNWYNSLKATNPCLGFSTLDDQTGKVKAYGPWRFTPRSEKYCRGGCLKIPAAFADAYTGGNDLGVGFGGYFNINNSASHGPALTAVAPPEAVANKLDLTQPLDNIPALPNVPLVGYPLDGKHGHRNSNYAARDYMDHGPGGTALGGSANTIQFKKKASWFDNWYSAAIPKPPRTKGRWVALLRGTGAGQERQITAYSNRTATVSPNWETPPDNTTEYDVFDGVAQAGSADTITLAADESADNKAFGSTWYLRIISGTGAGQDERKIVAYNGATKVATVSTAWETAPDKTSRYGFYAGGTSPDPKEGVGTWTLGDAIYQGGVWIDGPNKHGLLFFPSLAKGHIFYHASTVASEWHENWVHVYDPDDLAKVAQKKVAQDAVQPAAQWSWSIPEATEGGPGLPPFTAAGFTAADGSFLLSATYDEKTKTLYLLMVNGWSDGRESHPIVYAYRVNS